MKKLLKKRFVSLMNIARDPLETPQLHRNALPKKKTTNAGVESAKHASQTHTKWHWRAKGLMDDEAVFNERDKIEGKMEYESFFFFFWVTEYERWSMNYEIFILHKNTMRVFVYGLRDILFKFSSNIFDRKHYFWPFIRSKLLTTH